MTDPDVRWRQRLQSFRKALDPLSGAVALANNLLDDGALWMEMIQSRDRTRHGYDEETASQISEAVVSRYHPASQRLLAVLATLERGRP